MPPRASSDESHRNDVLLTGRLAAAAVPRTLPSGDEMVSWRLVVDRSVRTRRAASDGDSARSAGRQVDTLDCAAWTAALRRAALKWLPGDTLEVSGALRRRFWRGERGPASRCEVEVARARRISRAAAD